MKKKKCFFCERILPVNSFHRRSERPVGRVPYCKDCNKKRRELYRVRERRAEQDRRARDQKEMNDRYLKKIVTWHRHNKKTRTVLLNSVKELLEKQKGKCFYCKVILTGKNIHIEHYYPKSDKKIVLACADCNRLKWTRNGDDFIKFLPEYISRFH